MGERIQGEIMGILTEEMKRGVTEIQLCYAATVTPDGKPNLSPKGSITVLSGDELGFPDLAYPGTIENLRHNSAIELNVVDPFIRRVEIRPGERAEPCKLWAFALYRG
jgi:predicted pyridoxine 5'-phosphate oxidase superfamily flavin-nucleotide-binding protein